MDLPAVPPRGAARDLVRLDQHHVGACLRQMQRRRQSGEPAADDADIGAARALERRIIRHVLRLQAKEGGRKGARHALVEDQDARRSLLPEGEGVAEGDG